MRHPACGIEAPTLPILGSKANPPTRAVTELLCEALPNAEVKTLEVKTLEVKTLEVKTLKGADHMDRVTRTGALNRTIVDHLDAHRNERNFSPELLDAGRSPRPNRGYGLRRSSRYISLRRSAVCNSYLILSEIFQSA